MNKLEKIAELEKTLAELKKEIEKEKEEQIDVSKFISLRKDGIIIKGEEKSLISYNNGGLSFGNIILGNEKVTVTKTTLNKLKIGDIFIFESEIDNMKVKDFELVVGINNDGYFKTQYIENIGCDYIDYENRKATNEVVYKINRY